MEHARFRTAGRTRLGRPDTTRHPRRTVALYLALGASSVIPRYAISQAPAAPAARIEAAELMTGLLEHAPGLAVAVVRDGETVWSEAFGLADVETRRPATPGTTFRVFSAAKLWTATAAARLGESGRLAIDGSITDYVPSFPDKGAVITPFQLATHRAGIRHYADEEEARGLERCTSVSEALDIFADDPLLFAPGSDYSYSSWGYVLLSAAIEGAGGQPFLDTMNELFALAGLTSTVHAASSPEDAAVPYEPDRDGGFVALERSDPSCKWGAGGFLSTAEDLARFTSALLAGDLVGPDMIGLLLRSEDGSTVHRFGGFSYGGRSVVRTELDTGLIVSIVANSRAAGADLDAASDSIAAAFAGRRP